MKVFSRCTVYPLCLVVSLCLSASFPQGADGRDSPLSGTGNARRPASPVDCPDAVPHPGTIKVYVNEELRVVPHTEYPMPFINRMDVVDGKECNRRIPVVEVHESYRDSSGKYVSRDDAYWLTITGYDLDGNTFNADGINDSKKIGGGYTSDMTPSLSADAAQSEAAPTREQLEMKTLDKTFFEIADYLETHLPITPNTLEDIGFTWESSSGDTTRTDYKTYNYRLRDSTIIEEVDLRHYDAAKKRGGFLVFRFGQHAITRESLESRFGEFVVYAAPRGKSVHERITWGKELSPNLTVMFGQNQLTRETVGVTFDNKYSKE